MNRQHHDSIKALIRPVVIRDKLIRVGQQTDGAYVIPERILKQTGICYSYGVSDNVDFDLAYHRLTGNPAHLYDPTVDAPPNLPAPLKFHREGLSAVKSGAYDNYLAHLKVNQDDQKKVLLKIDVEGAEYEWLLHTDLAEVAKTAVCIVLEFHWIHTNQNIWGCGEGVDATPGTYYLVKLFEGRIKGKSPLNVHRLFEDIRRSGFFEGAQSGMFVAVLTAVETALWDLAGKALGLPVYQLLGGKFRDKIRVYCDTALYQSKLPTPKDFSDAALNAKKMGFNAIKFDLDQRDDPNKYDLYNWTASPGELQRMVDQVAAAREAVGPLIDICLDMHGRYDAPTAQAIAKRLEPMNLLWLEEPIPAENIEAYKLITESTSTPICAGENIYLAYGFRRLLEIGAVDIIMPDLQKAGDFSQTRDNTGAIFNLIKDPNSSAACTATSTAGCFQAGGVLGKIPADRLYSTGIALLSRYPLPNVTQGAGLNYNYEAPAATTDNLTQQPAIRIDYQLSSNFRVTGKYSGNRARKLVTPGTIQGYNDVLNPYPFITNYGVTVNYQVNNSTFVEGTYGFIRFSLPLLPKASVNVTIVQILAVLSIIGIIYGALVSLMQQDWKKLVAYSSVSHLGFCTLGIFAMNPNGIAGSVIQQINHGISTGMLFLIIGIIYERRHTREIAEYGGLAHVMPKYAIVFAIAMLSSAGLPLLNGFVGEFTILQGAFEASHVWAAFAVMGVILGAAYLLWLYQRTMLGQVTNGRNLHLPDMTLREMVIFLPLIAWAIWIGVYPKPYFDLLEKPVQQIVERVRPDYYQGGVQKADAAARRHAGAAKIAVIQAGAAQ